MAVTISASKIATHIALCPLQLSWAVRMSSGKWEGEWKWEAAIWSSEKPVCLLQFLPLLWDPGGHMPQMVSL